MKALGLWNFVSSNVILLQVNRLVYIGAPDNNASTHLAFANIVDPLGMNMPS